MIKTNYKLIIFLFVTLLVISSQTLANDAHIFNLKEGQTVIGQNQIIRLRYEDTFLKIAHDYGLGYQEIEHANPGIDPWLPFEKGTRLMLPLRFILPKDQSGIHINLAEYRLYYFYRNKVMTFPISIGRGDWKTPTGSMQIIDKIVNPSWYPTPEIRREHALEGNPLPRVVPPGPDNPLGRFALQLNEKGYFIHGTNRPYGIGMQVTHGCIRLRPNNIETLFNTIPRETPVKIYFDPHRVAFHDEVLYMDVDPPKTSSQTNEYADSMTATIQELISLSKKHNQAIDWDRVIETAQHHAGIVQEVELGIKPQVLSTARPSTTVQSITSTSFKKNTLF